MTMASKNCGIHRHRFSSRTSVGITFDTRQVVSRQTWPLLGRYWQWLQSAANPGLADPEFGTKLRRWRRSGRLNHQVPGFAWQHVASLIYTVVGPRSNCRHDGTRFRSRRVMNLSIRADDTLRAVLPCLHRRTGGNSGGNRNIAIGTIVIF